MLSQEQSLESKISARDKRAADVFWWTLMAMRAVIPEPDYAVASA